MYKVNAREFTSYFAAVAFAKTNCAEVFEQRADGTAVRRWAPLPVKVSKKINHVIVNSDGSTTPFSKVRN